MTAFRVLGRCANINFEAELSVELREQHLPVFPNRAGSN
jgi:hypothetical protein